MAAVCEVCGKHPSFGNTISHFLRHTIRASSAGFRCLKSTLMAHSVRVNREP